MPHGDIWGCFVSIFIEWYTSVSTTIQCNMVRILTNVWNGFPSMIYNCGVPHFRVRVMSPVIILLDSENKFLNRFSKSRSSFWDMVLVALGGRYKLVMCNFLLADILILTIRNSWLFVAVNFVESISVNEIFSLM